MWEGSTVFQSMKMTVIYIHIYVITIKFKTYYKDYENCKYLTKAVPLNLLCKRVDTTLQTRCLKTSSKSVLRSQLNGKNRKVRFLKTITKKFTETIHILEIKNDVVYKYWYIM